MPPFDRAAPPDRSRVLKASFQQPKTGRWHFVTFDPFLNEITIKDAISGRIILMRQGVITLSMANAILVNRFGLRASAIDWGWG